jgi:hypothetical protein
MLQQPVQPARTRQPTGGRPMSAPIYITAPLPYLTCTDPWSLSSHRPLYKLLVRLVDASFALISHCLSPAGPSSARQGHSHSRSLEVKIGRPLVLSFVHSVHSFTTFPPDPPLSFIQLSHSSCVGSGRDSTRSHHLDPESFDTNIGNRSPTWTL